jgi:hypothetical protein
MMTSRSLICLLENQNGGKLQKKYYGTSCYEKLIKKISRIKDKRNLFYGFSDNVFYFILIIKIFF